MTNPRLTELEIKFMDQAETLESLSQTVYQQQKTILALQEQLNGMAQRLSGLTSNIKSEKDETPPPHY